MNIRKFKSFESKDEEELIDTVKKVFSFLIDEEGFVISKNSFGIVLVKYKVPSRSGIINNDIDEFIEWSQKVNDVVNDIKVAITRLSMIDNNITSTFKYEINNSISIKIAKEDSIVYIKNARSDGNHSSDKLIYFSYPTIVSKFKLSKDTKIQMGYLSGARVLYITTPPGDYTDLIEEFKKVEGFQKHYITPTGKLTFKFESPNCRYSYIQ